MVPEIFERTMGEYRISTDRALLDVDAIEKFLRQSYWAADRPRDRIERSISNSLCFSLLHGSAHHGSTQIGFARVVTDYSDFAWLCDVFIDEDHRGKGLGKFLMESVLAHPDLQGLRRVVLATRDAHELYAKYGFRVLPHPERWMEREV